MNCPACGRPLVTIEGGTVTVDACDGGCGGLWLDHYELLKLDEPAEPAGAALAISRDPSVVVDVERKRPCPKCTDGAIMLRHFSSVKRQVTIDECPACGGIWLDFGELVGIRSEFPTDDAREAAAEAMAAELVGELGAEERAETQADLARAQRFASAFKYILPSYYMKGKQDWGAY